MSAAAITVNDLTPSACFALAYAQAIIAGKGTPRWNAFVEAQQKLLLSSADQRAALAKGLAELREMGIVECQRDGEGDLVPTVLHEERIQASDVRLITGDRS